MQKTNINPANLQQMLDSASNAAAKGQAQYLTPEPWAAALAAALPQYRPVIVDFTSGPGNLLRGAAGKSTAHLLGCDIEDLSDQPDRTDPADQTDQTHRARLLQADITRFFPMLAGINWECDLTVLNPPWDLHWDRSTLSPLAISGCPAVASAYAATDPRLKAGRIDSTVATLMMALDRMTPYGEGFIIANESTLQRLILGHTALHRALRAHCWAHAVITGNICTNADIPRSALPAPRSDGFQTGVLWFARTHTEGFADMDTLDFTGATPEVVGRVLGHPAIREARRGAKLKPGLAHEDTLKLWQAAANEWRQQQPGARPEWNIWLDSTGAIRTNLSLFDTASGRVDTQSAARLHDLNGRHPMRMVMQRAERTALENAALGPRRDGKTPWRVAPAVIEAVHQAVAAYNSARAPLYPLSKIQRLGYVDECDKLLCTRDLALNGSVIFQAGLWYALRTETLRVKRDGQKVNETGSIDDVEFEGSELAIYLDADLEGDAPREHLFMDLRFMAKNVELSGGRYGSPDTISFTLQQLCDHFEIPDVPDVATVNPAGYQRNLELLGKIEEIVNA